MPNWCHQTLEIQGPNEEINLFIKAITIEGETDKYSLNQMFPCPEDLVNTISGVGGDKAGQTLRDKQYASNLEKYGYKDWYDWNCDNWGTKWGACDVELRDTTVLESDSSTSHVGISFESAWSPATQLIQKISESYPNCIFGLSFTEESNAFAGCIGISAGQFIFDKSIDTDSHPDFDFDTDEGYEKYQSWFDSIMQNIDEALDSFMDEFTTKH